MVMADVDPAAEDAAPPPPSAPTSVTRGTFGNEALAAAGAFRLLGELLDWIANAGAGDPKSSSQKPSSLADFT
jgi:hypothetical protein